MVFIGQSSIKYMISLSNIKFLFLGQCLSHPKDQDKWGIPPHPVGIFSSLWFFAFHAGARVLRKKMVPKPGFEPGQAYTH